MNAPSATIAGVVVEPYVQLYESPMGSGPSGELLSRPSGVPMVEEFFDGLSHDQHRELLAWQLALKEQFTAETGCRLSINVDNELIQTMEQRMAFLEMLEGYPTPATFEFTETHPMPPVVDSNLLLRKVRELGHQSSLDDFGTGLNGMSLLTDYDFDIVKIDRSLVYDIGDRLEKRKTVKLIRQMLGVLGKKHVVEGVEDEETHRLLLDAGFTTFQGYAFHRPEHMDAVVDRFSSTKERA